MEKPIVITIIADKTVCYERLITEMLDEIPEDHPHTADHMEILELAKQIDKQLR